MSNCIYLVLAIQWCNITESITIIYSTDIFIVYFSPTIHDEMDIVGQDGHIYKGRVVRSNLPPIIKVNTLLTLLWKFNPLKSLYQ